MLRSRVTSSDLLEKPGNFIHSSPRVPHRQKRLEHLPHPALTKTRPGNYQTI